MEIDFWEQRWSQNQIAFHLSAVNPCLVKFWSSLNVQSGSQVFVPLCGKSLDLSWFSAQQYSVLGIECSEQAIVDFFGEKSFSITKKSDDFKVFSTENIKILQGDFFALKESDLKSVSAVYDRASIVAMPEESRQKYVNLLSSILPANVEILLITLEYNQSLMAGPPFSVSQDEVFNLYKSSFNVELLDRQDVLGEYEKFKQRGLDYLTESVYRIWR